MEQQQQEQLKELWEWCGWRFRRWFNPVGPNGEIIDDADMPALDLNNLFKYALPKLLENYDVKLMTDDGMYHVHIVGICKDTPIISTICYNEPELALFWAIWEVIHG